MATPAAEPAHAVITDPPLLRWHESTHAAFPRPFRQQAAALLLCWQRLASCGPSCSSSSGSGGSGEGAGDLGCLPFELVGAGWLLGWLCI